MLSAAFDQMPMCADLAALARQLVPARCPRCGSLAEDGYCRSCQSDFTRIASPCPDCGLPGPCRPCPAREPAWELDAVLAPFDYGEPLARQLRSLKYARQRRLGVVLGRLFAAELGTRIRIAAVDALVPVPLHPRRLRARTFNQADEIAGPIARSIRVPLLVRGIRRQRDTRAQTALDRQARLASIARAFVVENRSLAGLRLAVVDDVITTGATVNALAAALKSAGAASIVAWAIARTTGSSGDVGQSSRNR